MQTVALAFSAIWNKYRFQAHNMIEPLQRQRQILKRWIMSTIWKVSSGDMAELAKKTQRLNPFMKLAWYSFVFLDFFGCITSPEQGVSQT